MAESRRQDQQADPATEATQEAQQAQDQRAESVRKMHTAGRGKLEHSMGGPTTRDDLTDMGAPMTPTKQDDEPQGPEDAFGPGPKRGDYTDRLGGVNSFEVQTDGTVIDQNKRAEDVGDAPGKGGVTTEAPKDDPARIGEPVETTA